MEILLTSIIAFASTNIDDIFILTLFYGNKKFSGGEILVGQLLGISSLIGLSLIGALAGLFMATAYIGLLGLVPVYLGMKGVWKLFKHDANNESTHAIENAGKRTNALTVAGVTIANGGDNIGIYVPLFATLSWSDRTVMILVFLVMTFFWCMTAKYLTTRPFVAKAVDRYGHLVTPFVLILLGLFILYESETFGLLR